MKVSKKEKYLLGILGTVLVSVLYYQFVYTPQVEKLNAKKTELSDVEKRYSDVMETVNNIEKRKTDVKVLNSAVIEGSREFYPAMLQEKIILELDALLEESGLNGNIAFSPIEVASVKELTSTEAEKSKSSFESIVDSYNNISSDNATDIITDNTTTDNGQTVSENTDNTQVEQNNPQDTITDTSTTVDNTSATVEQLKLAINFSGTYEALKKFVELVENYDKKVIITNTSITPTSDEEVSGVMNLEFFAIPKLSESEMSYLIWSLDNTYGKDTPFSVAAATGAYSSTVEEASTEVKANDFVMMLRSPSSELPTLTIGKANDTSRASYLYSDKPQVEETTIEFNEENGSLYYKYNTADSVYPSNSSGFGNEFTANSKEIVVEVSSEARVGDDDNSGIKLNVVNNTNRKVQVIIKSDDTSKPRINVSSAGNTVTVTKK